MTKWKLQLRWKLSLRERMQALEWRAKCKPMKLWRRDDLEKVTLTNLFEWAIFLDGHECLWNELRSQSNRSHFSRPALIGCGEEWIPLVWYQAVGQAVQQHRGPADRDGLGPLGTVTDLNGERVYLIGEVTDKKKSWTFSCIFAGCYISFCYHLPIQASKVQI